MSSYDFKPLQDAVFVLVDPVHVDLGLLDGFVNGSDGGTQIVLLSEALQL